VALVAFYLITTHRTADTQSREWTRYFIALDSQDPEDLVEVAKAADLKGTPVAYWANLLVADRAFSQGSALLFEDRAKANEELNKAVTHYKEAIDGSDPLLRQRALFGLARTYESQPGKLQDARAEYDKLISQFPNSIYASLAKKRVADIDRDSTKEFYDWFADAKLPTPPDASGGVPGEKPPFSLEGATDLSLPDLHEPLLGPANTPGTSPDEDAPDDDESPLGDSLSFPGETDAVPESQPAEGEAAEGEAAEGEADSGASESSDSKAPTGETDTPTSP
jgi:tetratricopeptide (TPR) repeat protein